MAESDAFTLFVGKVFLGCRALELALRDFLRELDRPGSSMADLAALPPGSVGQTVASSVRTNPDSLRQLIAKFNATVTDAKQGGLAIDPGLADARDLLVEGRTWGSDAQPPLRTVRFSIPTYGLVRCESDEMMDLTWLETAEGRVRDALTKVDEARQAIQPESWAPVRPRAS